MSAENDALGIDIVLDRDNLYREESYTDLRVGSLRRLTPVKVDGSNDEGRDVLFIGQTQLMSQMGPLPISCPIEAKDLEEAIDKLPDALRAAVEHMIEEAKETQRQEASRILVPGQAPPGGMGPVGGGVHGRKFRL